jgi:DNA-binding NarL/FixJ family response regulator
MLKSHGRISGPGRQIIQPVPSFFLPVMSLEHSKPKQAIKLIIADDNPRARHGLRAILAAHPELEVVGEASRGDEALALAETLRPDVAIMDVRMPLMDGIQAARAIKHRWAHIRVVLISIYAEYQTEARSIGADAFLVKGCPAEELIAAVINQKTDAAPT